MKKNIISKENKYEIYSYNDASTEEFITWINRKYKECLNIINKLNEVPN